MRRNLTYWWQVVDSILCWFLYDSYSLVCSCLSDSEWHLFDLPRPPPLASKMSHPPPVSCIPNTGKMSKVKKVIDEAKQINNPEIDLVDKGISNLADVPGLCESVATAVLPIYGTSLVQPVLQHLFLFPVSLTNITRLSLSHNKISVVPASLANLINLEILNFANNHIEELPISLSSLPKLRILNVSLNRLNTLPRGFGAFPVLEVLDLTYNNLNEKVLPGNFFMIGLFYF